MLVEGHPLCDPGSDLCHGVVAPEPQLLLLQTPPEALNKDVVHPAPLAVHADAGSTRLHGFDLFFAGELATLR